jgi:hypothetical protein
MGFSWLFTVFCLEEDGVDFPFRIHIPFLLLCMGNVKDKDVCSNIAVTMSLYMILGDDVKYIIVQGF